MKVRIKSLCLAHFLGLFSTLILAQPVSVYQHLLMIYQSKAYPTIIAEANHYLNTHPKDGDVRLILAKAYIENNQPEQARQTLIRLLVDFPNYSDASLILANLYLNSHDNEQALLTLSLALIYDPENIDLLKKKSMILTQILASPAATVTIDQLAQVKALNQAGKSKQALAQAKYYLSTHPKNTDLRLFVAKLYQEAKDYKTARIGLTSVLSEEPKNIDARLMLINIEINTKHYPQDLRLVKAGLKLFPKNPLFLKKQKDILNLMHAKTRNKAQLSLKPERVEIKYLNQIGVYQQQYYISSNHAVWDYSTLYYGRQTDKGLIFAKATYDNRLNKQGVQGEVEAYPIINPHIYLDLDFSYANQPNLFPDTAYGAEAYISSKLIDYSFGFKFNNVDKHHQFTIYSGSLSKNIGQHRILFRPYYFAPGLGPNSNLFILDFRRIIQDPFFYFGCIIGTGSSPDLANLTTVNFIKVQNKLINPYVNFPLLQERLIVNLGILAQNQIFNEPRHFIRNWLGGTIGLDWRF